MFPKKVRIVEVGPRDGLQNEAQWVEIDVKVELIEYLVQSGLRYVEAISFVSPQKVPKMRDASYVLESVSKLAGVCFPVLSPNMIVIERAMSAGASEICIFTYLSETFSRKNINSSITESFERFHPLLKAATNQRI